jgi:hypothetical protein
MNPPEENPDPLDALLREQNQYIGDDGFTAKVLASLPRRRNAWLRPAIVSGATATGSVLAILWLPWKSLPALDSAALLSLNSQVLLPWFGVLVVMGVLVWNAIVMLQTED